MHANTVRYRFILACVDNHPVGTVAKFNLQFQTGLRSHSPEYSLPVGIPEILYITVCFLSDPFDFQLL